MWKYEPAYGPQYLEQNECKIFEADCRYHQAYVTICVRIPNHPNHPPLPTIPCPDRTPLQEG